MQTFENILEVNFPKLPYFFSTSIVPFSANEERFRESCLKLETSRIFFSIFGGFPNFEEVQASYKDHVKAKM